MKLFAETDSVIPDATESSNSGDGTKPPKPTTWENENDPEDPQNWRPLKKWTNMAVVGWIAFTTPLASSMLAPGLPQLAKDLQISQPPLAAFSLSVFLLGSALSALLAAPLSEIYGRMPVYHFSNVGFTIFTLVCGFSPNYAALIVFRLLAGCFGSACLAIGMGTCADMFSLEVRARAGSGLVIGLMMGPCLGPVIGGLLVQTWRWRSVFYALSCLGGLNNLLSICFLRETYAPVILRCKPQTPPCRDCHKVRVRKGNDTRVPEWDTIRTALMRPLMLILSPVVMLVCLFSAIVYSVLYLVITTIPFIYSPRYGFSSTQTGLLYLAPGSGMLIGLLATGQLLDRKVKRQRIRHQRHVPEDRVPICITLPAVAAVVCGLLFYGWTTHFGLHWAVPLFGLFAFGTGLTAATSSAQIYLVECYLAFAASVSAANSVLRSLSTGLLPLGGIDMYDAMGIGWGTTLLAGLVALSATILLACRLWGVKLRSRFPVKM